MNENAGFAHQPDVSRERLRLCVADVPDDEAARVQAGTLTPIVWQLGHAALVDAGFAPRAGDHIGEIPTLRALLGKPRLFG